jgi:hypothetical protein
MENPGRDSATPAATPAHFSEKYQPQKMSEVPDFKW